MGRLVRLELYKLRTVRAPLILLALSQIVIIGGVTGLVFSVDDLSAPRSALQALAHAGLVSLITLVLGAMAVAGEYRNKTITDAYLSTPRRGRVIAAKSAAYALAGTLFASVNAITALASVKIWWSVKDIPLDLTDGTIWRTVAGCAAWNIVFTIIGVGIGALTRNLTAAIADALVWVALVEGIVGQLLGDLARWLPYSAGSALARLELPRGSLPLPQAGAALVLACYAVLFTAAALVTTVRRDIT